MRIAYAFPACLPLLALIPAALHAQDYYPLDTGHTWTYQITTSDSSYEQEWEVMGPTMFRGVETVEVAIQDYDPAGSPLPAVYYAYYSRDELGRVFAHGDLVDDVGGQLLWVYDPPMLLLDAPLFAGHSWSSSITVSRYLDGEFIGSYVQARQTTVEATETIAVIAGQFTSLRLRLSAAVGRSPAEDRAHTPLLRSLPASSTEGDIYSWYTSGIGLVKFDDPRPYARELICTSGSVTAETCSWGWLKQRFD